MSKRIGTTFARTMVVAGIELAFCGLAAAQATPAPAAAASAPAQQDDAVQTVQVTGTRASLAKSLDLKRNSAIVQDSISATELGRFPDDNVADSPEPHQRHLDHANVRRRRPVRRRARLRLGLQHRHAQRSHPRDRRRRARRYESIRLGSPSASIIGVLAEHPMKRKTRRSPA